TFRSDQSKFIKIFVIFVIFVVNKNPTLPLKIWESNPIQSNLFGSRSSRKRQEAGRDLSRSPLDRDGRIYMPVHGRAGSTKLFERLSLLSLCRCCGGSRDYVRFCLLRSFDRAEEYRRAFQLLLSQNGAFHR